VRDHEEKEKKLKELIASISSDEEQEKSDEEQEKSDEEPEHSMPERTLHCLSISAHFSFHLDVIESGLPVNPTVPPVILMWNHPKSPLVNVQKYLNGG